MIIKIPGFAVQILQRLQEILFDIMSMTTELTSINYSWIACSPTLVVLYQ